MEFSFSLDEVVGMVGGGEVRGRFGGRVTGIAGLPEAGEGDLSFLGNPKYKGGVAGSGASVILLPEGFAGEPGEGRAFILVKSPSLALARFCGRLERELWRKPAAGRHASAVVAEGADVAADAVVGPLCVVEAGAVIGAGAWLEAQVFVGRNARIGAGTRLGPRAAVLAECVVGERVTLHAGVVIGSDGFGYEFSGGRHEKVPQVGNVEVGDDVEIGANTAVDRARFGRTVIGEGTKIDNLVQIGHNVVIGKHCILCGQVGVAGSTVIGDYAVLGGQTGVAGHLKIGAGAKFGAKTGVAADVEAGAAMWGSPALAYNAEQRLVVLRRRLPELFARVGEIERRLGAPEKASA